MSTIACFPGAISVAMSSKLQAHRPGIACGRKERRAFAVLWADGAEDVGRGDVLVVRRRRAPTALSPAPRDLVPPAEARLISEPDFYFARIDAFVSAISATRAGRFF